MKFYSTKTYGHDVGLSCAFRQWRADHSHCKYLHGYSLAFTLTFSSEKLDSRNWVADFGGLKPIKAFLERSFDHKVAVASDDPELELLRAAEKAGLVQLTEMEAVGCEMFAKYVYDYVRVWLTTSMPHVELVRVDVREHGANSASYGQSEFR